MRESVIASFAGMAVMSATAALAAALLTWEPSIVAPATASVASAALVSAPPAVTVAAAFDLPAPELPADLADLAPPAAEPSAVEPVFAGLSNPAGGSFGFRSVLPEAGSGTFAEPGPPPQEPATPAMREMVRREVGGRDTTLASRSVLPPPRPAFIEVRTASASAAITDMQPSGPAWPDLAGTTTPAWPNLFGLLGDAESRSTRPERTLQSGMASWYGPGFHGRRTASGELFNQNALTAAHRNLPFGTKVRVVDQATGRSIVVRINDRGPFSHGRVIDLSRASAQALGMSGTTRVKIVSAE